MPDCLRAQLPGVGPVGVDAAPQFTRSKHGVVCVLCCVCDELWIVGGLELPVFDGAVVSVGAEHGAEGLERTLGAQLGVQVVEDREIVQGVPAMEGEAQAG